MKIQELTDASFGKYGKVVTEFSFEKILKEMEHTPLPKDVVYVPSVEAMEILPEAVDVCRKGFGGLPIQIGYCNGDNHKLNALEYHRSSEIDIAVTDLILLLGCQQDIEEDDTYDTSKAEAFFRAGRNSGRALCNHASLCALLRAGRRIPLRDRAAERDQRGSDI